MRSARPQKQSEASMQVFEAGQEEPDPAGSEGSFYGQWDGVKAVIPAQRKEAVMLRRIRSVNVNAGTRETNTGTVLAVCRLVMDGSDQNSSEIMNSRIGSCLLHGTKELVKMAIRRSRGESMDAD